MTSKIHTSRLGCYAMHSGMIYFVSCEYYNISYNLVSVELKISKLIEIKKKGWMLSPNPKINKYLRIKRSALIKSQTCIQKRHKQLQKSSILLTFLHHQTTA